MTQYYKTTYKTPIGNVLLAADDEENLVGLWLYRQKHFMETINSQMTENNELEIFKKTKNWLKSYFKNEKPEIKDLPLAPYGSDFRKRVWQILCKIPYGKTAAYGQIAKIIAKEQNKKMSAQAIGNAIGHNPISIIIPCHRVIGSNGSLTGYAGGIRTKIKLLKHEKAIGGR